MMKYKIQSDGTTDKVSDGEISKLLTSMRNDLKEHKIRLLGDPLGIREHKSIDEINRELETLSSLAHTILTCTCKYGEDMTCTMENEDTEISFRYTKASEGHPIGTFTGRYKCNEVTTTANNISLFDATLCFYHWLTKRNNK